MQIDQAQLARQRQFMEKVRALNGENRPLACIRTLGCQQNVSDSEKLGGMLAEMGYAFTGDMAGADLVIYNTCAVRDHAERRALGNVNSLKPYKVQKPSMLIAMCGCMMQEEGAAERVKRLAPHVDMVFGTGALWRFPEILWEAMTRRERVVDTAPQDFIAEGLPLRRGEGVKGWLPVSYGCNNFCTYCIVPYVRGRERSRRPEDVIAEARRMAAAGYKDITLLGQNVNSYGNDLPEKYPFARLLREIDAIPGDFRIRFMTSHPKDATDELFHAMADCPKVARHIHLPFQSGSDRVLRAMNRRYTKEQYLALADRAKAIVPGLSLTSDIIVGFPGETYEDFEQTLDVVRRVRFDGLFTFIYSPRRGTPAARLEDPVPHAEKTRWMAELLAVQDEIGRQRLERFAGQTVRALCEGPGKTGPGWMTARTESNTIVDFPAGPDMAGRFCHVRITKLQKFMLLGELAEPASGGNPDKATEASARGRTAGEGEN